MIHITMLLAIMIGIILLVFFQRNGRWFIRNRRSNKTRYLFIGYGGILIVGMIAYLFIPKPETLYAEKVSTGEVPDLFGMSVEGEILENDSAYKIHDWEFEFTEEKLNIVTMIDGDEDYYSGIPIHIEQTKDLNREVEVHYFRTPLIINEKADLTKYVVNPKIKFTKQDLFIINPAENDRRITGISKEFPIKQFMKDKRKGISFDSEVEFIDGEELIYIRVPADIKVNFDDEQDIQFVGSDQE